MNHRIGVNRDDEAAARFTRDFSNDSFNFDDIVHRGGNNFHSESGCGGFDRLKKKYSMACGCPRIEEDSDLREARRNFLEQLKPFATHCKFKVREPSNIAPWLCQTVDKVNFDRVGDRHKHDWCSLSFS